MKTQTVSRLPKRRTNSSDNGRQPVGTLERQVTIQIPKIEIQRASIEIVGLTPLLSHRWSEEQLGEIRNKQQGVPKAPRKIKNPLAEMVGCRKLSKSS